MKDLLEKYKETMSHWPSGVAILTTHYQEQDYGMTVSSFTSVSLSPPMVSVCVDKRSYMSKVLKETQLFAVNILQHSQINLAKAFANHDLSMQERFKVASFSRAQTKSPVLLADSAWLDCSVYSVYDTGDHTIYVAEVLDTKTLGFLEPLLYYRRNWQKVS